MFLHYLVKLKMLTESMLPLSCYGKKLQNLPHFNCDLQIARFDSNWLHCIVWRLLQEKMYKICIITEQTEPATENRVGQLDHVAIAAVIRQWHRQ